jgi:branched-chain amino acid transport system substrate-binding protein
MSRKDFLRLSGMGGAAAVLAVNGRLARTASAQPPTIKIGANLAITGPWGLDIQRSLPAAQLAVKQINEAGGLNVGGKKYLIDYRILDNEGKPDKAVAAAERLVSVEKIHAYLGTYSSFLFLRFMDILERNRIPTMSTVAASSEIPKRIKENKFKYVWSVSTLSYDRGKAMAHAAADLYQPKSAATLITNDESARDAERGFVDGLRERLPNAKLTSRNFVEVAAIDFTGELAKIKFERPEVFFTGFGGQAAWTLVEQWHEMKVRVAPLAWGGAHLLPKWAQETSPKNEGWVTELGWKPLPVTPKVMPFAEAFKKSFGYEPHESAARFYDGALVLFDAIERAGALDPDAITKAIGETDLVGVRQRLKFLPDEHRTPITLNMIAQIRAGVHKVIYPKEVAELKFEPIKLPF